MRNFKVIKASAGSGKTFTLVKEYLKLCLSSKEAAKENYKHILAITFTKSASKDMRRKITEELSGMIESPDTNMAKLLLGDLNITPNELQDNAQTLLSSIIHNYSDFCVGTIDSFNQKLSRSFATELGLPPSYTPTIEDDEISDILVENIGLELGNDERLTKTLVAFVTKSMEEDEKKINTPVLIKTFFSLLQKEEAYETGEKTNCYDDERYKETSEYLSKKIEETKDKILNHVKFAYDKFIETKETYHLDDNDFNGKATQGIPLIFKNINYKQNDFETICSKIKDYLTGKTKSFTKFLNGYDEKGEVKWYNNSLLKEKRFTDSELDAIGNNFTSALKHINDNVTFLLIDKYKLYKFIRLNLFIYTLRSKIESEIQDIISENEKVSISEFNKRIATVLGDYSVPFIYERIGERYKHIFIDEFQDTSLLQWQNIMPLLVNCLSNGGECLVVGDGKQSIYHFRSGEVRQLTELPEIFQKPDNPAFDEFEQKIKEECLFESLNKNWRTSKTIVDFNNDFFDYFVNHPDFNKDIKKIYIDEEKEAKIHQEHTKDKKGLVQVELVKTDNFKEKDECDNYIIGRILELVNELHETYRYKDIAIIIQDNDHCDLTAFQLAMNNIPVISSTSLLLKRSMRVMLIVNTLSYLVKDDNPYTIAAILYFWNKLQGIDITEELSPANSIARHEKSIESYMGLDEGQIKASQTKACSLYDLCASLARLYNTRLKGFDTLTDPYLNYFLDTIHTRQTANDTDIVKFLDYWDKNKNKLSIKSSDDMDAVKIVTIHKSKGLEYPVVIYPFSKCKPSKKLDNNFQKWVVSKEIGNDFDPIPNINKIKIGLNYEQTKVMKQEEQNACDLENINRMYVAMTRPEERLYIITKTDKDGNNIFEKYFEPRETGNGPLVTSQTEAEYGVRIFRYGDDSDIDHKQKKEEMVEDITDSTTLDWTQKIDIDLTDAPNWLQFPAPETMNQAEWGKIVHLILAEITTGDDIEKATKTTKMNDEALEQLKLLIRQMIATPEISEAFSEKAKIRTECEILYCPENGGNGKIKRPDRYAELPDRIIIIDYKTGHANEEHERQISTYAKAVSQIVDKPIEKYLVYFGKNDVNVKKVG